MAVKNYEEVMKKTSPFQLPERLRPFAPIIVGFTVLTILVSAFSGEISDHEASKGIVTIQQTPTVAESYTNFEIAQFQSNYFELTSEKIGVLLGNAESTIEGQMYEFTAGGFSFPAEVRGISVADKDHIHYQVANSAPLDMQFCPGGVSAVYAIVSHPTGTSVQLLAGLKDLPIENAVGFNPAQTNVLLSTKAQTSTGYEVIVEVVRLEISAEFRSMVLDVYVYSNQPGLVLWGLSLEHECQVVTSGYALHSPSPNSQDALETKLSVYGIPDIASGRYQLVGNIPFQITNYDLAKSGTGVPSNVSDIWMLTAWPKDTLPKVTYADDLTTPIAQEILFQTDVDSDITVGVIHLMNLSNTEPKSYVVVGLIRLFGITVRFTE
jgi:hypothetical protein